MKKIIIASIPYYDLFFDQDLNFIKSIHEKDGEYRDEYFNPILKHFDITVERFNITAELDYKIYEMIEEGNDIDEAIKDVQTEIKNTNK